VNECRALAVRVPDPVLAGYMQAWYREMEPVVVKAVTEYLRRELICY
jgi:hypothetical protein